MEATSKLPETFSRVRRSIIAFASHLTIIRDGESPPLLPNILGTGFFVDERGIAVTNRHVVEALANLPSTGGRGPSAFAMVFTEIVSSGHRRSMGFVPVRLKRRFISAGIETKHHFYGDLASDVAIVQLDVRDVPALRVPKKEWHVRAGMPIATAGFPLGTDPLLAYGNVSQLTPTLKHGIVSGIFPFDVPYPHGFTIDVMSQGGASGSPVFDPENGDVLGVIQAGFAATNISLAVPGWLVSDAVSQLLQEKEWDFENSPTIEDHGKGKKESNVITWEKIATWEESQ